MAGICVALRIGSLLLAGSTQFGPDDRVHPVLSALALALASVETLVVTVELGQRYRRHAGVIRPWLAPFTAVMGAAVLVLQLRSLPAADLTSTAAWAQQYTVISCVIIAVLARWRGTVACVGLIAVAYAATTLSSAALRSQPGQLAVAADNVLAYPTFAALAFLAVGLYRSTAAQAAALRAQAASNRAEQERLAVTSRAHGVAHDIGKSFLREVLIARLPADALAAWAGSARANLLQALVVDPRERVDLRKEIAQLCLPFLGAMPLTADLSGMTDPTDTVPPVFVEAIREALNNASYHAPGAAVHLSVATVAGMLAASVTDLGPGCDPETVTAAWESKPSAFARLRLAGGDYRVECPRPGTRITLRYPLEET